MMEVRYLGQNGFKISLHDITLYFDLYLSDCVFEMTGSGKRKYPAPVSAEEIRDADVCLISHDHLDHLDPPTIKKVAAASPQAVFICPFPHAHLLADLGVAENRIVRAEAYKKILLELGSGSIAITPVPEKHEEYTLIGGRHGTLGYVVEADGRRFYHAGDAVADKKLAEDLKACGRMDVMFLPINGHDWQRYEDDIMGNMNYREALDLCRYVGTDLLVPMHYDLFDDNTENPAFFVDYLYRNHMGQQFKMFMPGETIAIK